MPCHHMALPGGGVAIVCTRGRGSRTKPCVVCHRDAPLLCDGLIPKPSGGTRVCSRPLCPTRAVSGGAGVDWCPDCAARQRPAGLIVHTARIGYPGPDGLDVTRKSATGDGLAFAPSWDVLRPAIDARTIGGSVADAAWAAYVPAFTAEMRASYRAQRAAWDRLLARGEVTLLCYCSDSERCHRTILAAVILPRLGATYAGERVPAPTLPGMR